MPDQPGLFDDESPADEATPGQRRARAKDEECRRSLEAQHVEARDIAANLPASLHCGTSSWSFPGWAGLVYGARRTASALALDGLREYAAHPLLTTVGIDRSFYAPIPIEDFRRYADQLPAGFRCCIKAPAAVTSMVVPETRRGINPDYLAAPRLVEDLLEPCAVAFAEHTGPIVVEFPPMPREMKVAPTEFAERLDGFLGALPRDFTYAIELRNRVLLTSEYATVLARHGATHTFNYWSGMPLPGAQSRMVTPDALASDTVVIRLLLRPGTRYVAQRESFRPFNRLVEPDGTMRDDTVALMRRLTDMRRRVFLLVNNKAEGSSPLTIMALARQMAGMAD